MIIITKQLSGNFGQSIDSIGSLYCLLRGIILWSGKAKDGNRTGSKDGASIFSGYFQHIIKAINVYFPGQLRILFTGSREDSCKMKYGIYSIFINYRINLLGI